MRDKRFLGLVIAELVLAVVFAASSAAVFLFRKDDLWLQAALVIGGAAGFWNGIHLLKRSRKPPRRRRSPTPNR